MSDFVDTDIETFEPGDRVWTKRGTGDMRAAVVRDDGSETIVIRSLDSPRAREFVVRRDQVTAG